MYKRLFKDSFAYSLSSALSHLIALVLLPFFSSILTTAEYGVSDILQAFNTIVRMTVSLEIYQALARYYIDAKDSDIKKEYASTALFFTIAVYLIFLMASLIFSNPISYFLLQSHEWTIIYRVQSVAIALYSIIYLLQLQSRYDFRTFDFVASSLTYALTSSAVAALCIIVLRTGIVGLYIGQICGALLGIIVALRNGWKNYALAFSISRLKEMLSFSVPLIPSSLGFFITGYIDRFAIQRLLSISAVGVYGISFKFASITSLLLTGFASALNPLVYKNYRDEDTPRKISVITNAFIGVAAIIILGFFLFSSEILLIFTDPKFYGAKDVMPILIISSFLSNMVILSPGLYIAKKTKIIAILNILIAGLNTSFNFLLIPYFGILGAAFANVTSSLIKMSLYFIFSYKYYPIPFDIRKIRSMILITATTIIIGILIYKLPLRNILIILFKIFLFIFASIININIFIGLKNLRTQIKKIFKKTETGC